MKLKEYKNTKKQGDAGLGIAISWFAVNGYVVSIPLTDSQDYDLIAEIDGTLKRVQVKTTTYVNKYGRFNVSLTTKGGNQTFSKIKIFDPTKVEFVFVITGDGTNYLIPSNELGNSITLGDKYDKFKVE